MNPWPQIRLYQVIVKPSIACFCSTPKAENHYLCNTDATTIKGSFAQNEVGRALMSSAAGYRISGNCREVMEALKSVPAYPAVSLAGGRIVTWGWLSMQKNLGVMNLRGFENLDKFGCPTFTGM